MKTRIFLSIFAILLVSNIAVFAAVDLKFNNTINMAPASPSEGALATFSVMFIPSGEAVNNLKCTWGIDGTIIGQKTFAHLNANATTGLTFEWTATAGNHTAWFELDPDHLLGDTNYSNNRIEKTFSIGSVTPTGKPNLTVSAVYNPSSVTNGANITFTVTVTNIGNAPAAPSKVGFYVFGGLEGEYDVSALNQGQKKNITINWIANCNQPCNAYINIKADSTNLIDESNENDNDWIKFWICDCASNYKPNMTVSANYSPAVPKKGDKVTFNIIVKNEGNQESPRVYLGIYLFGNYLYSLEVEPMPKNSQKTFTYDWTADCSQPCHAVIDLFIDNQNEAEESNENDNHWTKDISCDCLSSIPPIIKKNGLILNKNITVMLPNLTSTTKSYSCYAGQKKADLLFGITNNGKAVSAASKLTVKVYENANLIHISTVDIPSLNVNQIIQKKVENIHCVHNAKMVVTIDTDNNVTESKENDNEWTETINCPNL